ncbi:MULTISPECIES: type VI secretion system baseplate subunit TssG [unclassified Duganella]|uniref:type VI secretion system baseplate subunit TssG n=1 Tax=unclassified Duganella TaxID=2636909 RepID=UPI000E34B2CF|nr:MULTISPECIES: type VI secretion system baseplate subunit TssG [unclassified Duganella]RFP08040.1 type VI secretion system baseplate subunit TssG [Duganella sp. BJB475]RFP23845.1 type VI secretion system baseplate subunit TssG [Duganella sp. BJB476]
MPASQRRTDAGLIDELLAEPQGFEFFQAVRLVEQAQPPRRLRYRNRLSLAFPPNQIENVSDDGDDLIRLTPAFMGLLGSHGALPLHYSERLHRHERTSNDGGPRAFLDMLSHRSLCMFYQAWAKHRPECMTAADDGDGFLAMLLALSGTAPDGSVERETLARYAMQLRSRSVSAPLMAGIYSEYFNARFVVEQLVGQWQALPAADQARLGKAHVDLGAGVMLGERIYGCDARVRLRIGPLDRAAYEDFLPGHSAAQRLEAMLGLHCGVGMTYEVHLIQRGEDVRTPSLDGGCRLGVNTCLVDGPPRQDREELMYLLHT